MIRPRPLQVIIAAMCLGALFFAPLLANRFALQAYYLAYPLVVLTIEPLAFRLAPGTLDVFEPIIPISRVHAVHPWQWPRHSQTLSDRFHRRASTR